MRAGNPSSTRTVSASGTSRKTRHAIRPLHDKKGPGVAEAARRLQKVSGIDVTGRHHAGERGGDSGVVQQRLQAPPIGLGEHQPVPRRLQVGLGLVAFGGALRAGRLRRHDVGLGLIAGRLGRPEVIQRLIPNARVDGALPSQLLHALRFRLPAHAVGGTRLRLATATCTSDAVVSKLARATRRALSACLISMPAWTACAFLLLEFLLHLRHPQFREQVALADAAADLDAHVLDVAGNLGVDRRPLKRLNPGRLLDDALQQLPRGPHRCHAGDRRAQRLLALPPRGFRSRR